LERLFSNVDPFYFVTFNTYKRLQLLARPEIHERFACSVIALTSTTSR